jgi:hypothetical protein
MTTSHIRSWGWQLGVGTAVGISVVALVVETQVFATSGQYFAVFTGLGLTVMLLATTGLFALGPALSSRTSFLIG